MSTVINLDNHVKKEIAVANNYEKWLMGLNTLYSSMIYQAMPPEVQEYIKNIDLEKEPIIISNWQVATETTAPDPLTSLLEDNTHFPVSFETLGMKFIYSVVHELQPFFTYPYIYVFRYQKDTEGFIYTIFDSIDFTYTSWYLDKKILEDTLEETRAFGMLVGVPTLNKLFTKKISIDTSHDLEIKIANTFSFAHRTNKVVLNMA